MTGWWRFKALILRLLSPLFFQKVGKGTMFTGRIRLPIPFRKVRIGNDCMIGHDVYFQTGRNSTITLGNGVSVNTGCHIIAMESITIGENVAIGEYVSIRDQDHRHTPGTGVRGQGFSSSPIAIEENCWIGRGVHIGPGCKVGSGSIVAANSVLRGVYPENVLIAGAPATIKRAILASGQTARWDGTGPRPDAASETVKD